MGAVFSFTIPAGEGGRQGKRGVDTADYAACAIG